MKVYSLSTVQVARQLGVAPEKIRGWIRCGYLPAVDLAGADSGRQKWRISTTDLEAFLQRRESVSSP